MVTLVLLNILDSLVDIIFFPFSIQWQSLRDTNKNIDR